MKVYIYDRGQKEITKLCEEVLIKNGFEISDEKYGCYYAVAPWCDRLIPDDELRIFKGGVLIFHPSLLPIYRGKNAVKDAFKNGDKYTGVTWFWGASGYDKGDICEQAVLRINEITPSGFYYNQAVPAAISLLEFICKDLSKGVIRSRPQILTASLPKRLPNESISENGRKY